MNHLLKRLSAAIVVVTTTASAQDCRSTSDSGATRCVSGVLYRCTCTRGIGATTCTWDNAAALCSAISELGAPRDGAESKDMESRDDVAASAAALTP
jgi:hypothetical protein